MSEMQKGGSTALTIRDDQTTFTQDQATALQHLGVEKATRADVDIFFHQCKRTGLDPFAKQIYMIERQGKQTIQTGIDGFRLIADRTIRATGGALGYEDTQWCDEDGNWRDVWIGKQPPAAARVTVIRNGQRFPAIALYDEYVGRKRNGDVVQMWKSRPAGQLAKCAEALALRRAFPQDLSGLYTADEMQQAENPASSEMPPAHPAAAASASQAEAREPASLPSPDAVDQGMHDNWDNVEALRKLHKWLRSSNPQDPRLARIAQRGQELATQASREVHEGEIVEDTEQTETLPMDEGVNA